VCRYHHYLDEWTLQFLWGFTVAIFAVGGMLGSLSAGWASKKFGLKNSMALNSILALAAALFMGLCKVAGSFEMLIIGEYRAKHVTRVTGSVMTLEVVTYVTQDHFHAKIIFLQDDF